MQTGRPTQFMAAVRALVQREVHEALTAFLNPPVRRRRRRRRIGKVTSAPKLRMVRGVAPAYTRRALNQ